MIALARAIFAKDFRLALFRGAGVLRPLLLGLLLVFALSLARGPGEAVSPAAAAAAFWTASTFSMILIFNQLYALEDATLARQGLLLLPAPAQGVWLGKLLTGLALLLLMQAVLAPACAVFLGQDAARPEWRALALFLLTDLGLCAGGALIGGLGQAGRESLLAILLFPLLMPLLLAGAAEGARFFGAPSHTQDWFGLVCAFDAIFLGAGFLLFGFLYSEEE